MRTLILIIILLGAGYLVLANCFVWRFRARRVTATIKGVRASEIGKVSPTYATVYEYADEEGRTVQATSNSYRKNLKGRETGRTVPLLVAADTLPRVREAHSFVLETLGAASFGLGLCTLVFARPERSPLANIVILLGTALACLALRWHGFARTIRPPLPEKYVAFVAAGAVRGFGPLQDAEQVPAVRKSPKELKRQRVMAVITIILGVLSSWGAYHEGHVMLHFKTAGQLLPADVIALKTVHSSKSYVYCPIARFTLPASNTFATFQDGDCADPPSYTVGEQIQVRYIPGPGITAVIDTGVRNFVPTAFLAAVGGIWVVFGSTILLRNRRRDEWSTPPTEIAAPATELFDPPPVRGATRPTWASVVQTESHAMALALGLPDPAPTATAPTEIKSPGVYWRWALALFVINLVLVIAPWIHKNTGFAAFGAFLFVLLCVLALVSAVIAVLAQALVTTNRVTGAIRQVASTSNTLDDHVQIAQSSYSRTVWLREHYANLKKRLWRYGFFLAAAAFLFMSAGFIKQILTNSHNATDAAYALPVSGYSAAHSGQN
jgi:hypothetical protein